MKSINLFRNLIIKINNSYKNFKTNKKLNNLKENSGCHEGNSDNHDPIQEIDANSDQIDAYENSQQTKGALPPKEPLLIVYDDRKDNQEESKSNQTDNIKEICLKEMVKDMATFNWSSVNSNLNLKSNEPSNNSNSNSNGNINSSSNNKNKNNGNDNEIVTKTINTSKELSKIG